MTYGLARLTHATWLGVHAAVRTPRIVAGDSMTSLLQMPPVGPPSSSPDRDAALATAIAFSFIRHLSRLPGTRWRNSCLFRAAAECWILRSRGLPAVVRIGVSRTAGVGSAAATTPDASAANALLAASAPRLPGDVAAHAWVECAGVRCQTALGGERDAYVLLESHG